MIIGIAGNIEAGKDTVGKIIQYLTGMKSGFDFHGHPPKLGEGVWNWKEISGWEIKKYAEKLKHIASLLTGIPRHKFEDQEFKKTYLGPEWRETLVDDDGVSGSVPMTVRRFLQKLGTEAIRDGLHLDTWCNALFTDYEIDGYKDVSNWVITDMRFENEAQRIVDHGGKTILVMRENQERMTPREWLSHKSETELDDWTFDYAIDNNGTLEELTNNVKDILLHMGILEE